MAGRNEFTEAEKALIKEIAFEVWEKIKPSMMVAIDAHIASHAAECPAPKRMRAILYIAIGISAGLATAGSGIGYLLGVAAKAVKTPLIP